MAAKKPIRLGTVNGTTLEALQEFQAGDTVDTAHLDEFTGDSGAGGASGIVPAPAAGDAAADKYLHSDGTWKGVSGAGLGDVTGPGASTDETLARFDGTSGKTIQGSGATLTDAGNLDLQGNLTLSGTVDGRDVATDGTKLDGVEALADVTDAANVASAGAVMDSDFPAEVGQMRRTGAGAYSVLKDNLAASVAPTSTDDSSAGYGVGSKWVDTTGDKVYFCLDATVSAAIWQEVGAGGGGGDVSGPASSVDNRITRFDGATGKTIQESLVTLNDTGSLSGVENITLSGTVDGRDLSTDGTKLDGIEALADVTDATNVAAAGAVMDSDYPSEVGVQRRTGAGAYTVLKDNLAASVAPTANDDSGAGYAVGSLWIDTTGDAAYICLDATAAAAVWRKVPVAADFKLDDLGTPDDNTDLNATTGAHGLLPKLSGVGTEFLNGNGAFSTPAGGGDVTGPASSVDNRLTRFDGATGKTIQESGVTLDDTDNLSGLVNITLSGTVDGRDVGTDGTKLDGIEALADVTDATNVAAAGAVMDGEFPSEVGVMRRTGAGAYSVLKDNLGAAVDPTVNEDSGDGYAVGSLWINTTVDAVFVCLDATVAGAVWRKVPLPADFKLDDLATPDDNTDLNATTGAHGLLPKLSGVSTQFLDGTGAFSTPAGGGDVSGPASHSDERIARWDGVDTKTLQQSPVSINDTGSISGVENITLSGTVDSRDVAADGTKLDTIATSATANPNALETDQSGEIAALTEKVSPAGGDHLLIEDSAASNSKKRVLVSNLPAGTPADNSITFAKMQDITTDRLIGRDTAATGDPEEVQVTGGLEFTGTAGIQRSALTGDVTASAGSNSTTIAAGAVTFAKMQDIATDRLIGRDTAATGDPEELTVGGGVEFTGTGGIQRSALTGDVAASAGSNTTTIGTNAVGNTKLAQMASNTIKGNDTGGLADPKDLTKSEALALLNVADGATANPNAVETDQSGEIAAVTEKTAPVQADLLLAEDSEATNVKKRLQLRNLTMAIRARELERHRAFIQTVPGDVSISQYGVPSGVSTRGTLTSEDDNVGAWLGLETAASVGNYAGILPGQFDWCQARYDPELVVRIRTPVTNLTNVRLWVGLFDETPNASATPTGHAIAAFRYENGTDTGWTTYSCDGSATTQVTSNVVTIAADTVYELRIEVDRTSGDVRFWVDGVLEATHSTTIPDAADRLSPVVLIEAKAAEAEKIRFSRMLLEQAA